MLEKIISSSVLGPLVYNEKYNWYENTSSEKYPFALSIYSTEGEKLKQLLATAERLMASEFYEQLTQDMAADMTTLKNTAWLEDDEDEITVNELRERVTLESIVFYEDFTSQLYYKDDDLFDGHCIVVEVDERSNYKNSTLAG